MASGITRRTFGVTLGALAAGCSPSPPEDSPVYRGRYPVARALLGTTPGTKGLPFPEGIPPEESGVVCPDGEHTVPRPRPIPVMVYYPALASSYDVNRVVRVHPNGGFPLVLVGHARRLPLCPNALPMGLDPAIADITQDFRRLDFVLDHVASHGFVVCVPDVSWDFGVTEDRDTWPSLGNARAQVLVASYAHMRTMNEEAFQRRIDLRILGLVGHSTGGAACLLGQEHLPDVGAPGPRAFVFVAPATNPDVARLAGEIGQTLVLKGTFDTQMGANPDEVWGHSAFPKARVTLGGANHFGYTDVCAPNNQVCGADDRAGGIARPSQQIAGATFIGAFLRRFLREDTTMTKYLDGSANAGLATFGVADVTVEGYGV